MTAVSDDAQAVAAPGSPRHTEPELEKQTTSNLQSDGQPSPGLRNSKGWDGKLRVRRPSLANPEALSDPEYSDDENVLPGKEIGADEGRDAA
jgi:protein phosphatase 1 regulatory subunit 7